MSKYTAIIGDVHGCREELDDLLKLLPPGARIIIAGDLVDRGPDSPGVVRRAREIGAEVVCGNHDFKHQRYIRKVRQAIEQGKPVPANAKEEITNIVAALSDEDRDWMMGLPYYIKLPEHDSLVVHAGVPPAIQFLPPNDEIRGYPTKKRKRYEQLWFVRYVDENGYMVGNVFAPRDDLFHWTEVYDGQFGTVYYGHEPYMDEGPRRVGQTVGIDLACAFGGKLCAVVLEEGVGEVDVITVDAKAVYSDKYIKR